MVTNKRKKNTRQRGSKTHGWGAMKKHRGAGNRGGVGNAGSGKRGDAKKPSFWKNNKYFGVNGFKKKGAKISFNCINLDQLVNLAAKAGKTELNLGDFGFNKLLGKGAITKAYTVTVDYASEKAVEKIQKAKGKINVLKLEKSDSAQKVQSDPDTSAPAQSKPAQEAKE